MKKQSFCWNVGYMAEPFAQPAEMYPAVVPGAVQLDYARAKNWPDWKFGVNFRDYKWMEDMYWLYTAKLDFALQPDEVASLRFKGIDYQYQIRVDGEVLCEDEGMFSHVLCDVTRFAGAEHQLEVVIFPVPKADDSDCRDQARKSCKAAACYGWDWHPRLVSQGLWDDVELVIQPRDSLSTLEASYVLSEDLKCCRLKAEAHTHADCIVRLRLMDGETIAAESVQNASDSCASFNLTLEHPKLWQPVGYGEQHLYTLVAETLTEDGSVQDALTRRIGLRRSRLVMNEGSWKEPAEFPKSRSDAPATLEINGRRLFGKGSNWVNAQAFPGEMTEEHYRELLTLVRDANMNLLRIWGGGFINKESFFDLCDELGIMVWQEFPLACNEYPDEPEYLSVLEKEATAIVRRLRTHPCVVLWCGGNELFNNWSKMTDQHHALRLLNSVCYAEDRYTPFNMTSPLNGMSHGHYYNYDERTGEEMLTMFARSRCTAYTEFGAPGAADPEYIQKYLSEADWNDNPCANDVWREHHARDAWQGESWLRPTEVNYFLGGYTDTADLCRKTQQVQAMGYRSCFEEMRRQWPHCSMAVNWCYNEPWPCFANNSLISWPNVVRPAYEAVRQALRPCMASLQIQRQLWHAGETFRAGVWLLNDSIDTLAPVQVEAFYALGDGEEKACGVFHAPLQAAQTHAELGGMAFAIPEDFAGMLHIRLAVREHPEWSSEYDLPCRGKGKAPRKVILNQ